MAKNGRRLRKVKTGVANTEPAIIADGPVAGDLSDTKGIGSDHTELQSDLLGAVKSLTASINALTSALADARIPSDGTGHAERALFSFTADLMANKPPGDAVAMLTADETALAWVPPPNAPRINIAWELSRFFNDPQIQPSTQLSKYGVGGPGTIAALGARLSAWPAFAPYNIKPDSNALAYCFYVSNLVDYLASLLLRAKAQV